MSWQGRVELKGKKERREVELAGLAKERAREREAGLMVSWLSWDSELAKISRKEEPV
jgi:hypothetical protein